MKLYLVNFNYDFNETAALFSTRAEMVAAVADSFEVETEERDTPGFWAEVHRNYDNGHWKGLNCLEIDTLKMTVRPAYEPGKVAAG